MPYFIQLMLVKANFTLKKTYTYIYTIEMYDQFHDVSQQMRIEPLWRIELGKDVLQATQNKNTRNQLNGTSSRWPPFYTLRSLCHTQFKCQMLNVIVLGTFVYL